MCRHIKAQALTGAGGYVCRITPGGIVCVTVKLTMFPCSSTELVPKKKEKKQQFITCVLQREKICSGYKVQT